MHLAFKRHGFDNALHMHFALFWLTKRPIFKAQKTHGGTMEMNEVAQTEPTETLQALAARVWKIEEAHNRADSLEVGARIKLLKSILPEPTERHLRAAEGDEL
jgi:hypothetical protein